MYARGERRGRTGRQEKRFSRPRSRSFGSLYRTLYRFAKPNEKNRGSKGLLWLVGALSLQKFPGLQLTFVNGVETRKGQSIFDPFRERRGRFPCSLVLEATWVKKRRGGGRHTPLRNRRFRHQEQRGKGSCLRGGGDKRKPAPFLVLFF